MASLQLRMWQAASLAAGLLTCGDGVAQRNAPQQTAPQEQSAPQGTPAPIPVAPQSTPPSKTTDVPLDEIQTKRQMGIMPNFRSVSPGEVLPPQTLGERFKTTTQDNFDYSALFFAGFIALEGQATKQTPEFHQGMKGYARYYWHTVADQSVENYYVEFILPTINHEDSRYYAMGKRNGGFWKRAGYSLSRVIVTKTGNGRPTFNYSEILGSAMAVGTSTFYYPTKEQTVGNGLRNWGLDVTYDSITFMFHEFWPDISYRLFRKRDDRAATISQ
jgi:hypothetical protein